MARASATIDSTASPAQVRFPTPSPFSVSSSLRSSSRHYVHLASLSFRAMSTIFSVASALVLARSSSFVHYPELVYCFIVSVLVFGYSALQLIKGICDIAYRGFILTEKVSDYTTFIADQLVSYLLISSCSVSILAIQHLEGNSILRIPAITSSSMSFATFFVMASCSLLSGYRLCKRIIW